MPTEIKMPQLGESVVEGTITKWLKQEGDSVDEDELLVEVSTDKVDSEVPSSASGTIQEIKVQEGETVKVGEVIAVIGEGGSSSGDESGADEGETDESEGDGGDAATSADDQPETEGKEKKESGEDQAAESDDEQPQAEAADEGDGERTDEDGDGGEQKDEDGDGDQAAGSDDGAQGKEKGSGGSKAASSTNGAGGDGSDTSKRGIISPLVRRLADEHGVDLEDVEGSGTGGRIRKQDVLKFVETGKGKTQAKPAASAEPAPDAESKPAKKGQAAASGDREELVPWTNIRRRTAEHMVASARETARAWNAVEVDWTNVVKLREQTKDAFKEREGFNLTYMGFLGRALCEALLEMPEVNATFDEENQANRIKHYVNLGIAVALEGGGLIVPVIKGADELNLVGLSRQINEVAQKARSKKLSPDDLTGGTFTITNPGPFGSVISVPIIPRGQAAILGFETIRKGVVVTDDDTIAIRSIGILDLSWDHRVIDGAEAARFLSSLKERIETMDFSGDLSQYL
ncbi:MAG: 2-oxo acid dehydrogenase subunit E2 [Actinomycetota bacterium]|nr:2-oxo acid dehydrogenase subunit E2 [Actinomycetota bacterium]